MTDWEQVNKDITARVQAFSLDIIAGKIGSDVIKKHGISEGYLAVCRDNTHPSKMKYQDRLFQHLMRRIGYYDNIANEKELNKIYWQLEDLLQAPVEDYNQKGLYMPRIVRGLNNVLDRIEKLNGAHIIDFAEKGNVTQVTFSKAERWFELSYQKEPWIHLAFEDVQTPTLQIEIEGEKFVIPKNGGHLQNHIRRVIQLDEVTIELDKFHHSNLKADRPYYFRYITEVKTKEELDRVFETSILDIDGNDTIVIDAMVEGRQLLIYFFNHNDRRYMVIEYDKAITAKEMSDLCFSTLVAFGMITTDIHLNECWLAAYDGKDKQKELGLFFHSLVPTIHCEYSLFTTNVYTSLVHVAKKIDPKNGSSRACEIIDKLKLWNALMKFPSYVLGSLIENFRKYEDLQRGIFIILMGSKLHLEIQPATYCVAMEAIANVAPKIIGDDILVIVKDKPRWKAARKVFAELNSHLQEEGKLNAEEYDGIDKKINSMNNNFNNVILKALLVHYKYPLTSFDDLTLKLRNVLLHGSIEIDKFKGRKQEDYLFELSMNLHKLCCSIALLMAGYKGYIINNRKLYDYPNSYKAFIRIGDNMKVDYPEYKEKKGWKEKARGFFAGVWKFCSYLLVPQWGKRIKMEERRS